MSATTGRIARSIGGVFLRQLYTVTIGLLTSIVFARLLGPSGVGAYATALLLPAVLAGLFNMGLGPAAVVFVNSGAASFVQAMATALFLWRVVCLTVVPITAVLIYAFGTYVFPNVDLTLLYVGLLLFPFLMLNTLYSGLLQSKEDFGSLNFVLATTPTLTCAVGILAVEHYGPLGAMGALLTATMVTSAIAHWRLRKHVQGEGRYSAPLVKAFLRYGLQSNAADSIQLINYRADLYFVNYFVGSAGAGLYALAISLCEKLWLIAEAMTAVLFPRFARLGNDPRSLLVTTAMLSAVVSIGGAIVLAVSAYYLIEPVFGSEFRDASNAINWLLPGVVAICFGKILTAFLAARGKLGMNLISSAAGAFVNLSSNLYLTPRYGIVGAAMATSLGYFVIVLIAIYAAARELRRSGAIAAQGGATADVPKVTPTI